MRSAASTLRSTLAEALCAAVAVGSLQQPVKAWPQSAGQHSAAREWSEVLLESTRNDLARSTTHARNLYHVSIAMWDAWATYDSTADTVLFQEDHATSAPNVDVLRREALCYASYQVLESRFANTPGALCIVGNVGRFVGPGQVQSSGQGGVLHLRLQLNALPTPTGPIPVQPGPTWTFQFWHRDANPSVTSNLTGALAVTFL